MPRSANPSAHALTLWLSIAVAGIGGSVIVYSVTSQRTRLIALGTIAFAAYLGAALYLPRKRLVLTRMGTLHAWMAAHLSLGMTMLVAVALHGGLTNIGTQGWLLYGLTIVEIGSGVWGAYELRATPRRFAQFAKSDFMYPTAVARRISMLTEGIELVLQRRKSEFRDWYTAHYRNVLADTNQEMPALDGFPAGQERHATDVHAKLTEVVRLRHLKTRIDAVDRRSRRWLILHVPTSVALTTFIVIHIAAWLYF